jgi:tetratricopeptide (TPR) repeat protein
LNHIAQQFQLAKQAYANGDFKQALQVCDQLLKRLGARDDLLNVKALSLLSLGRLEDAETTIRAAIKLNPNIAGMHINAARIYKALCLNKRVKRHILDAVRLAPREAVILNPAAGLCVDIGDYSLALRIIDRCLQLQPGFSPVWALKGLVLIVSGKTEEARPPLEKAVELDPENAVAMSDLVRIRGDKLTDSVAVTQLKHIRSKGKTNNDRGIACFALANMYHRDGQYDEAFNLFVEANRLVATGTPFDPDAWEQKQRHVAHASSEPGALDSPRGNSGANLVFILGMPRSGTTLCEQVLSMSNDVLASGELAAMDHIESGFERRKLDPYKENLSRKELDQAADTYVSALPNDHQKFRYVTDKAPMNFERIGLIRLLFPQARFFYCIRHPLDTILSCFMQNFQAGMKFAVDLEHISRVYIAHAQLMKHWMKLLPGQIHIVNYEQYIANQEAETRSMAGFLQLGFEQGMLTPHLQERVVITASNLQVRRPVYSSSIGRWKNYQSQLDDAINLLRKAELLDADLNSLLQSSIPNRLPASL